jgi:hypothetical protein
MAANLALTKTFTDTELQVEAYTLFHFKIRLFSPYPISLVVNTTEDAFTVKAKKTHPYSSGFFFI